MKSVLLAAVGSWHCACFIGHFVSAILFLFPGGYFYFAVMFADL
jgi:hypothetical protein